MNLRSLIARPLAAPVLACLLLVACSTPMPPDLPRSPPRAAPAPATPAPPPVLQDPAPPPPVVPPSAAAAPVAPPYGPQVAARFPDPGVNLPTPAFAPGRDAYTSNAELHTLLLGLQRAGGAGRSAVQLLTLGRSQAGVPLEALLFTRSIDTDASAVRRDGRPTVLLVGQQHGDEPAGGEALLVIAQQLANGPLAGLLDRINVIVLPRANPDGAATNQRVSASGIDINRDHLLLKTPEAQAQAQLMRDFRPVVVVDAHEYTVVGRYLEKFGTVQRFDALVQYAMTANLPEFVTRASEEWFRRPLLARLAQAGFSAEWYYTTSTDLADKKVSMGGAQPDTGRNVNGLKNAVSILIETRGVGIGRLHLRRRVQTHVTAMVSVLGSAAQRAPDLLKLREFVDAEVSAQACQGIAVVEAAATPSEYPLKMIDPDTGADKVVSVAWDSALELQAVKTRPRPCGYWLAADQTDAVLRLRGLGVQVQRVDEAGEVRGESYRETARELSQRQDVRGSIADAGGVLRVQVQTVPTLLDVPAGSYYVPLDQPLANLVLAALEPDTQNSYVTNRLLAGVQSEARVLALPGLKMSVVP